MSEFLKSEGVRKMEVRTLGGGELGRGQDVNIILVPKGGSTFQVLARIYLHSHVLSKHSKYFSKCLSERWDQRGSRAPPEPMEFVLEVQRDVQHYFNCFSNMYPPLGKSFESVEHGLELLKVASQIDFEGLMERISFLSSVYWSKVEEIRVREYAASPGFPRIHLKDLVSRLGLDESEENRQKQLHVLFNGVLEASSIPNLLPLSAFLEAIRCAPSSEYSRKIVAILSQAAKEVFVDIGRDCDSLLRTYGNTEIPVIYRGYYSQHDATFTKIRAISWILEALLKGQVAEELVEGIVHLEKIPKCISQSNVDSDPAVFSKREFAERVLLMYKEVVAGRLVLKPPERMALLANWHPVLKSLLEAGTYEAAAADLFQTLPLKQQAELIHLQKKGVFDFISTSSLNSVLHLH